MSTQPTQQLSLPPLRSLIDFRSHSRETADIGTYAMNPFDSHDMFRVPINRSSRSSGLLMNTPLQDGEWRYYPTYNNSVEVILDMKEKKVFARSLDRCALDLGGEVWAALEKMRLPEEFRWLQAFRIYNLSAVAPERQAIVIHDIIDRNLTTLERREVLEKINLRTLGIKRIPVGNEIYLIPEFCDKIVEDLWCVLHLRNQVMEEKFYGGILAKESEAKYVFQTQDYKQRHLSWLSHAFTDAY